MRRALLLLIDGLRSDVAESELAAGRLPNLARLTEHGSRARAATVFPSTTSVAYLPFLTGCLPGHADVPSIRWLDRRHYRGHWWRDRDALRSYCGYQAGMLDADINPRISTIFELVPESVAIYSMITRGLSGSGTRKARSRQFWGTVSHYTQRHQPGDDAVAAELLRLADEDWRFCFAQFPAVDGHTHASNPLAPRVLNSLYKVDRAIGQLTDRFVARGELEEILFLIVSDHGASQVHHHLDLATWFRSHGARALAHPNIWTSDPQVATMVAGNGQAALYANPGSARTTRATWDELRQTGALGIDCDAITTLLDEPAVGMIAGTNKDGSVQVATASGEATLTRADGRISYKRGSGDPLEIGSDKTLDDREWLAATIAGPWPDAPLALIDQFRSDRTGDLVLAAAPGWDFRERWEFPEHRSGHGSLTADHMITPFWSNKPLGDGPWRTVDALPRLLEHLGVPVPDGIDGQ